MKIMTIIGTRPEIIKLSCVIPELDRHFEQVLVHTGQNFDYELNEIFFEGLGLRRPDVFLDAASSSVAETIGAIIAKADQQMASHRPDALLILGDTNSCLSAIAAKRRKIPIFHMEAGNRCFDLRVPEEINRKIVDHISDINLVYTEHARRYLLAEGVRPETVIKTGSPMREVILQQADSIARSTVLAELDLHPQKYFIVSAHREENVDNELQLEALIGTLDALARRYGFPVIVSAHPRTRKRLAAHGALNISPLVRFMKPLGFADYIRLQNDAFCAISDSGTITEESSILGFPAVTIRDVHERPEGMDEGTLIMCGVREDDVLAAVAIVTTQSKASQRPVDMVADYAVSNVASKIARIIPSYARYVNQTVWGICD